jgi:DNA-binding CsgD family transcriptional regulator/biotin operon repressor
MNNPNYISDLSPAKRRRALVFELRSAEGIVSAASLATKVGVSAKTVERDILLLRTQGLEISSEVGRTGGFELRASGDIDDVSPDVPQILEGVHQAAESTKLIAGLAAAIGVSVDEKLLLSIAISAEFSDEFSESIDVIDELNNLVTIGVLRRGSSQGEVRFSSRQLRQELLVAEDPSQLREFHHAIGNELERLSDGDWTGSADQVALHLIQAGYPETFERSVAHALVAGHRFYSERVYSSAIQWFRWIAELDSGSVENSALIEAKVGLARSLAASSPRSNIPEAVTLLREAVDYYLATNQLDLAVEAAITDCQSISGDSSVQTDISGMVEVVIDHSALTTSDRGYLLAQYSQSVLTERNDQKVAKESVNSALAIAISLNDDRLRLKAEQTILSISAKTGHASEVIDIAGAMVDRAMQLRDVQAEIRTRFHLVTNLRMNGQIDDATVAAQEMSDRAELLGSSGGWEQAQGNLASNEMIRGNFGLALEIAGRARDRVGSTVWTTLPSALMGIYDGISNGFASASSRTSARSISRWRIEFEFALLGLVLGVYSPNVQQVNYLRSIIRDFDEQGGAPSSVAIRIAIEPLLFSTDAELAQIGPWLDEYDSLSGYMIGFCGVPVAGVMGIAAAKAGLEDRSLELLDHSIELSRKAGAYPQLACALTTRASLVAADSAGNDREELLSEAREIASNIGAIAIQRRIQLLDEGSSSPGTESTGPLTRREREVLALIASGMTTSEIGESLFITDSTVTRHTTNILEKIGARNRVEATGYAYRFGLVD